MPFRVVMCISQTDFFVSGLPGYCTAVMTTQVLTRKTIGVWDLTLEAGILAGNGWGTASKEKKTKKMHFSCGTTTFPGIWNWTFLFYSNKRIIGV